ncbi:MAG: asparagine synthase (glutamine-hydrolyzing) [Gemmataceae bacterium]
MVDLAGKRPAPVGVIQDMAEALVHRGPDEEGYLEIPGLSLASRRLSIVGLADGRQPISNEDQNVFVVFNGELFEYPELRTDLEQRGHRFATHCDTELIPHLWEEYQEGMFDRLRGQFAFALWDQRQQRLLIGRDRFGICPVYWTRQGDWLLFASEIKGLLASGMVPARPDPRGINHLFTFLGIPGPVTCFEGVQLLIPGHYLDIRLDPAAGSARIDDQTYWELDFPDRGAEIDSRDPKPLVDELEALMLQAVERRLRADVPVGAYLSGGVDSSLVLAMACHVRGQPIPTYTIGIDAPDLNETNEAMVVARHVGAKPVVLDFGNADVIDSYAQLIRAAESPVVDTSCAALMQLAHKVHECGHKVVLTGEGADEWLAGYAWFKSTRLLGYLDVLPGLPLSQWLRRTYMRLHGVPLFRKEMIKRTLQQIGGPNAWLDFHGLMSLAKLRFYGPNMLDVIETNDPYGDLRINLDRVRRWHPFHRGIFLGGRVHLPGLLLNAKGDRVAMNASVETRYPFLDEDVYAFLARLHPRWKLRGFHDKYLLRLLAERWLPKSIAQRRKVMFRAPLDGFHVEPIPAFVEQLLSDESLRKTGYFDVEAVRRWREEYVRWSPGAMPRVSVEMGLAGVIATQLWHHLYIDASLADIPSWTAANLPDGEKRPVIYRFARN